MCSKDSIQSSPTSGPLSSAVPSEDPATQEAPKTPVRKIIHIDMDAFYAAIEQRDNPELRGKPIVVGGSPNGRGVVATASYEARKFGLRSAMPASWAKELCPHVHFVRPRMQAYREVSQQVFTILRSHSELVEPLSLDEAYIDVSERLGESGSATMLAQSILTEIFQATSLTASAGVAPNKFLAKIASDMNKPNGLTVVPPKEIEALLSTLAVGKVPGIGKKTGARMKELHLETVGDIRAFGEAKMKEHFGKNGAWFYRLSLGIDTREVVSERQAKSVSTEDTFAEDLLDPEIISAEIHSLAESLVKRAEKRNYQGRTLTLKVTYNDFTKITRRTTREAPFFTTEEIFETASQLAEQTEAGSRPIRLLGLGITNFTSETEVEVERSFPYQLDLELHDEVRKK